MLKKKKKFELPHVYTIAFLLIILFAILTWIVPSGQFERTMMDTAAGEREVAVAGTYQEVPKVDEEGNDMRQGLGAILMAPTRGIQAASDVVAFVLLIGGSFAILTKTNAINAGMSPCYQKAEGQRHPAHPGGDVSVQHWRHLVRHVGRSASLLCHFHAHHHEPWL